MLSLQVRSPGLEHRQRPRDLCSCTACRGILTTRQPAGGKDGSIMLWDLRVPSRATEQFPVRGAQVHVEVRGLSHHDSHFPPHLRFHLS